MPSALRLCQPSETACARRRAAPAGAGPLRRRPCPRFARGRAPEGPIGQPPFGSISSRRRRLPGALLACLAPSTHAPEFTAAAAPPFPRAAASFPAHARPRPPQSHVPLTHTLPRLPAAARRAAPGAPGAPSFLCCRLLQRRAAPRPPSVAPHSTPQGRGGQQPEPETTNATAPRSHAGRSALPAAAAAWRHEGGPRMAAEVPPRLDWGAVSRSPSAPDGGARFVTHSARLSPKPALTALRGSLSLYCLVARGHRRRKRPAPCNRSPSDTRGPYIL
jgi:hypothetical protein